MKDWHRDALCAQVGPDVFFNEKSVDTSGLAKLICGNCPVAGECLQEALDSFEEFGVWGGKTAKERLAMLRQVHGQEWVWPSQHLVDWDRTKVCKRGHDLSLAGAVKTNSAGFRRCYQCHRDAQRAYAAREAEKKRRESA